VLLALVLAFSLHADWLDVGDEPGLMPFDRLIDEAARVMVFGVTSVGITDARARRGRG
jgi:hypothetical protein